MGGVTGAEDNARNMGAPGIDPAGRRTEDLGAPGERAACSCRRECGCRKAVRAYPRTPARRRSPAQTGRLLLSWVVAAIALSSSDASSSSGAQDAPDGAEMAGPAQTQDGTAMQHTQDRVQYAEDEGNASELLEGRQGVDDWTPSQVCVLRLRCGRGPGGETQVSRSFILRGFIADSPRLPGLWRFRRRLAAPERARVACLHSEWLVALCCDVGAGRALDAKGRHRAVARRVPDGPGGSRHRRAPALVAASARPAPRPRCRHAAQQTA